MDTYSLLNDLPLPQHERQAIFNTLMVAEREGFDQDAYTTLAVFRRLILALQAMRDATSMEQLQELHGELDSVITEAGDGDIAA
ncbi:hypothetical protein [Hymenobacter tenuis]